MNSYSLEGIDLTLLKYLNYKNGFFIEAGANDGLSQSNTALYEFDMNWTGLLVEPNKIKYEQCAANRPNSFVENYALVSDNYNKEVIRGNFHEQGYAESLTSFICDEGDYEDENLSAHKQRLLSTNNYVEVPCTTIDKLLKKYKVKTIDLFSLDVEGYEISVLNGMNFFKYRPKYFLIETTTYPDRKKAIIDCMEEKEYKIVEQITNNDVLFIDNNL